ncbi:MAG: response regulator [Alphaproteobacteria bacterium]
MIILLAEDEALIALALETTLREAGYAVLGPVATVGRALELARQDTPDLALVNIHLQDGGSGIELARELRDRWRVPVIFVSWQRSDALANRDVALGYLRKPYDAAVALEGVRVVQHLLEKRPPPPPKAPRELELFAQLD